MIVTSAKPGEFEIMGSEPPVYPAAIRILKGTKVRDVEKRKDVVLGRDVVVAAYSRRQLNTYTHWWFYLGVSPNKRLHFVAKDEVEIVGQEGKPKDLRG